MIDVPSNVVDSFRVKWLAGFCEPLEAPAPVPAVGAVVAKEEILAPHEAREDKKDAGDEEGVRPPYASSNRHC